MGVTQVRPKQVDETLLTTYKPPNPLGYEHPEDVSLQKDAVALD